MRTYIPEEKREYEKLYEATTGGNMSEFYKDYLNAYLVACGFFEHDNADIDEVEGIIEGRAE